MIRCNGVLSSGRPNSFNDACPSNSMYVFKPFDHPISADDAPREGAAVRTVTNIRM